MCLHAAFAGYSTFRLKDADSVGTLSLLFTKCLTILLGARLLAGICT